MGRAWGYVELPRSHKVAMFFSGGTPERVLKIISESKDNDVEKEIAKEADGLYPPDNYRVEYRYKILGVKNDGVEVEVESEEPVHWRLTLMDNVKILKEHNGKTIILVKKSMRGSKSKHENS